jgi:hypothetical protein
MRGHTDHQNAQFAVASMGRAETHREGVEAVLGLLSARGFGYDPFRDKRGERIHVTTYQGKPLPAVEYVNLEIHASNAHPSSDIMAPGEEPVEDAREMVVCCWPNRREFLFLSNYEARKRWHHAGAGEGSERTFYDTKDDKTDADGVLKILDAGRTGVPLVRQSIEPPRPRPASSRLTSVQVRQGQFCPHGQLLRPKSGEGGVKAAEDGCWIESS